MVSVSDKQKTVAVSRPPACPKDVSNQAKQEYCNQYAKWLLQTNTPHTSPRVAEPSEYSPSSTLKKKRPRDVEEGAEFWMNAALERALDGITNYSAAIHLFASGPDEELQDGETTQLCILKYPVPDHLVSEHGSDASVMILFAAGMHRLLYPVFHPPERTRRQPLPNPFSLQALQDKFTGCKRKVPISVLAHYCLFYTEKGWFKRLDDLAKVSSNATFKCIVDLPPELTQNDLVEIAKSL